MDIGFAGIGRMGREIALHLARAHHRVVAYDISSIVDGELAEAGVELVDTAGQLAALPMSVSMLPDGYATIGLLCGEDGLFARARDEHTHVMIVTVGADQAQRVAEEARHRGVHFADAPVSGSVSGARSRVITTMVGADEATYARIEPILRDFTARQFHVGGPGQGTVVKLAVNVVIGALNEAVGEAIILATRSGVDRDLFYSILSAGAAGGTYVDYKREAFLHPESAHVDAPVAIIAKDLALALRLAQELGVSLPAAAAASQVAQLAAEAGWAQSDLSHVTDVLTQNPRSSDS